MNIQTYAQTTENINQVFYTLKDYGYIPQHTIIGEWDFDGFFHETRKTPEASFLVDGKYLFEFDGHTMYVLDIKNRYSDEVSAVELSTEEFFSAIYYLENLQGSVLLNMTSDLSFQVMEAF